MSTWWRGAEPVLQAAERHRSRLGDTVTGSAHLLLALLDSSTSATVVVELGGDLDELRRRVDQAGRAEAAAHGADRSTGLLLSAELKSVLERSLRQALRRGEGQVGEIPLLLALLQPGQAVGTQLLAEAGLTERAALALLRTLPPPAGPRSGPAPGPSVDQRLEAIDATLHDMTGTAGLASIVVEAGTRDLLLKAGKARHETADQVIRAALDALRRGERRRVATDEAHSLQDDPVDLQEVRSVREDGTAPGDG